MHVPSFAAMENLFHARASEATGLDDFGEPFYRDNLRAYLDALDEVAKVTPSGSEILQSQIVNLLQSRLRLQAALKANPLARATRITAPVFILGLPRSGTTALQNILMCDARFQGLQTWLAEHPMPRPPRETWETFPEFQRTQTRLEARHARVPEIKAMHFMAAEDVDECRAIMSHCFANTSLSWPSDLEPYARWLDQHDMTPEYRYYADALRLIGANDADKTWLLKCPHHCISTDALLRVFPDARLIFLHRDPVSVVSSISSMVFRLRRSTEGEQARAERCGEQMLGHMDNALRKLLKVREQNPQRFVDLRFSDFMADPIQSLARVCDRIGMALDAPTVDRMRHWLSANPAGKHGRNRYSPEDFGLTAAGIRERFHYYTDF